MTTLNNKNAFSHYTIEGYVYSFTQGPDRVRSHEDARRGGINCIALAHIVLKDMFNKELPGFMKCYETFTNDQQFEKVENIEQAKAGDLVWFGVENPKIALEEFVPRYEGDVLANWSDFPIEHVGVFTGEFENDEPLVLHSTFYARGPVKWPLSKFKQYPKYAKIYGVQRLKDTSGQSQKEMTENIQLAWQF